QLLFRVNARNNGAGHVVQSLTSVKRVVGFYGNHLNRRIHFLEITAGAHDRAAGTASRNKMSDGLIRLPINRRPGGIIMGLRIHWIKILVGFEILTGVFVEDLAAKTNRAVGSFQLIALG